MKDRRRLTGVTLALASLWSCQRAGPLPALQLDGLAPAVRKTLAGAFETAKARPNNAAASGQLGKLLLAHGLSVPALASFERARRLDPGSAAWPYYAGAIYQDRKDFSQARKAFEEHLAADGTSFAGTVRLAETLFALGDKQASLERFAKAIGQRPGSPRACHGMGVLLQSQGKLEDARRFFERAQARRRGEREALPFDDPLMAEVRRLDAGPRGTRLQAQQLARGGKIGKAVTLLEGALREDPRQTGYRSDLMMYLTRLEKWDKAEEHFMAMVKENPDNAVAHAQRGELLVARDKCEEAVEAFDTALEIDFKLASAHQGLGECQLKLGRLASAESHFRKAIQAQPEYSKAHVSLGELLVKNRKFAEAIPHLLEGDEAHGKDQARVLFALGTAYENTGQAAKAREALASARAVAEAYGPASVVQQLARRR